MQNSITRSLRWIYRAIAAFFLLLALYLLAGIAGSLIPANPDWREPRDGIEIFIDDNGVHTGLVLPRRNAVFDWSGLIRAGDLPDARYGADHLLFGWGDRDFYREVEGWENLRPGPALRAIFASEASLVHVDHVAPPVPGPRLHQVRVSPGQYRRIVQGIRASLRIERGRPVPSPGYDFRDVFYAAHGHYGPYFTCNEWTGSILRDAGVKVGLWTPFNFSVTRWFDGSG